MILVFKNINFANMFYRRKVILALLQTFGGQLDKISFQKLLFLFADLQKKHDVKPAFDFVPYQKGCFSFQSYADMGTMRKYGQIEDTDKGWVKKEADDYFITLSTKDRQLMLFLKNKYATYSTDNLIKHTYTYFPYYATKSTIAKKVLNTDELQVVYSSIPKNNKTILYTIGYEGSSLENYLNRLILNDVKVLCDVRKNPLSMKYGFSKSQLLNACEKLDIKYIHIPNLGINSDKRQNLNNQNDYDRLFKDYKATTLVENNMAVKDVFGLLEKYSRIALTCFEANQCQCHRGTLAKAIIGLPEWKYELKHL